MQFFHIEAADLWGDYGRILAHGMAGHLERRNGRLQLERTGPFIPPITISAQQMIVVASIREQLECSGIGDYVFREVDKTLIVESDWHKWDRNAMEPAEFLPGDPEESILGKPHSVKAAAAMGDLFEVELRISARVGLDTEVGRDPWCIHHIDSANWNGDHIFRGQAPGGTLLYASEVGRQWLEQHGEGWIEFQNAIPRDLN